MHETIVCNADHCSANILKIKVGYSKYFKYSKCYSVKKKSPHLHKSFDVYVLRFVWFEFYFLYRYFLGLCFPSWCIFLRLVKLSVLLAKGKRITQPFTDPTNLLLTWLLLNTFLSDLRDVSCIQKSQYSFQRDDTWPTLN